MKNRELRIKPRDLIVSLALFLLLYSLFFIKAAEAHVLKTDGSIGAVLHIDPEDDPIAKQQSGFFFEFKDKQNKFNSQNCDCSFSIIEDGKQLFNQPLFQNNTDPSLQNASVFFTFPEKNVYQLKVTGKPNFPNAFQQFSLIYDVRVAREASNSSYSQSSSLDNSVGSWIGTHIIHLAGAFIVLGFLIFALIRQQLTKINRKR